MTTLDFNALCRTTVQSLILLLLGFCSLPALAVPAPEAPAVSPDGSYTVTYAASSGSGVNWLEEKVAPRGAWTVVDFGTGSIRFSGKASGLYSYRVGSLYWRNGGRYRNWRNGGRYRSAEYRFAQTQYSRETAVIVGDVPELDHLVEQANYRYRVRRGDSNADGRTDLYVERSAGGEADNGVIYQTLLQQNPQGGLRIVSATAAQLNQAARWPIASVAVRLSDFDVDGYIDVLLENLGSVIPGMDDLLLFSSGTPYDGRAKAMKAVDGALRKFAANVQGWIRDRDYFEQFRITIRGSILVPYCFPSYGSYGWDDIYLWSWSCSYIHFPVLISGYDATRVSAEAFNFTRLIEGLNGADNGRLLEELGRIIGIDLGLEGAKRLVFDAVIDDDNFWADLALNLLLRKFYCYTAGESDIEFCVVTVKRSDPGVPHIKVIRTAEGIFRPKSEAIPYTEGTYELLGTTIDGYTLEPGGPDCATHNCGKRIPEGSYAFSRHDWKQNPGQPVPILATDPATPRKLGSRDYILIHSGNFPSETVGCIMIGKRPGKEAGTIADSAAARIELQGYFDLHYEDEWTGRVSVTNSFPEEDEND